VSKIRPGIENGCHIFSTKNSFIKVSFVKTTVLLTAIFEKERNTLQVKNRYAEIIVDERS
jgi:hypothetical protein